MEMNAVISLNSEMARNESSKKKILGNIETLEEVS